MVKHVILWTLNPELSEDEKKTVKAGIKEGLEGLVGKVPGLLDVKVHIDGRLASSNADVMLDSTLESVVDIVSNDSLTGVERLVDLSHRIR